MDKYAKLLTEPFNYAVVQLPQRNFPGVVVQGDSLAEMVRLLEGAESSDDIEYVAETLREVFEDYKRVCAAHGIDPPIR
ncbi:MAG: hypothetical protein AAGI09_13490 [Pseudomonadota bacterium]